MEEITFVNVLGSNGRSRMKRVYLRGHCVFCLRKTDKLKETPEGKRARMDLEEMNTVPEVDLTAYSGSTLLSTVNWACGVLQRKDGDDDIFEEGTKSSTNFCKIPKMCKQCGDKIVGVDNLLTEVREGMRELGKVIRTWNTLLRCKDFGISLSFSGLGESKVEETMEFLEEFRNRMGLQKEPVVSAMTTEKEEEPEIVVLETDPLLLTTEGTGTTSGDRIRELPKQHVKTKTTEKVLETRKPEVILMETDPLLLSTEDTEPTTSNEMRIPTSYSNNNSPVEYENEASSEDDTEEDDSDSDPDYVKSEIEDSSDDDQSHSDIDDDQADLLTRSPPEPLIKPEVAQKCPDNKINRKDPESNSDSSELDEKPKRFYTTKKVDGKIYKYIYKAHKGTCNQCGRRMLRNSLNRHRLVCGKTKPDYKSPRLSCRFCRKEMIATAIRSHLKEVHSIVTNLPSQCWQMRKATKNCDLCNLVVPRQKLYQHLKDHVGEQFITHCPNPDCTFVTITWRGLHEHLKKGTSSCLKSTGGTLEQFRKSALVCSACGFSGGGYNMKSKVLRNHLLLHHETAEKNFACPISGCEMKFTMKQSVMLHLGFHDVSKPVKTQRCLNCEDKKEIKLEEMEAHLKEEHGVDQVIRCRKCPFLFPSWEGLVEHMYQHRFGELTCDICKEAGGKFARHVKLVEHYFTQHQIGTKWQCDQCPRSFWKEKSLHLHVTYDHNQTENQSSKISSKAQSFACDECENTVFKSEDGLRSHKIREHGGTPYSCLLCTDTFTSKVALAKHDKEVHKGIVLQKEFPCLEPTCGKVYTTKGKLEEHHKFVHLGEKSPNVCHHCGKAFQYPQGLKTHVQVVHLGIKNCVCEICGEAFSNSQILKKHGRIHTGERPYSCDMCGQLFRHKEALKAHLDGHQRKGADFRPNGPMKHIRKRVQIKRKAQAVQGSSAECPKD